MNDRELLERAAAMRARSYAPYSRFAVGAALLTEDGQVFTGCNVENAVYGLSICAERCALLKAVSEGVRSSFATLAIVGGGEDFCWPCGACRQMLYEFAPDLRLLVANGAGEYVSYSLRELLPHGFSMQAME